MRTCPQCKTVFKRCVKTYGKIKICPGCSGELYYSGRRTVLYEDHEAASAIVSMVENHISRRDGVEFIFEWKARVRELTCAYNLLDRAKVFLERQTIDVGLTAAQFVIEIVESILHSQFWSKIVNSMAMFMNYVSDYAKSVFEQHKKDIERKRQDEQLIGMVDFSMYGASHAN